MTSEDVVRANLAFSEYLISVFDITIHEFGKFPGLRKGSNIRTGGFSSRTIES